MFLNLTQTFNRVMNSKETWIPKHLEFKSLCRISTHECKMDYEIRKINLSCRAQDLETKFRNDFKICFNHFIFSWISRWFPLFQYAKRNCIIAWFNNHPITETFYQIVILQFECWYYKFFRNIFFKEKRFCKGK